MLEGPDCNFGGPTMSFEVELGLPVEGKSTAAPGRVHCSFCRYHPEDAQPAAGMTYLSCDVAEAVRIGLEAAAGKNLDRPATPRARAERRDRPAHRAGLARRRGSGCSATTEAEAPRPPRATQWRRARSGGEPALPPGLDQLMDF